MRALIADDNEELRHLFTEILVDAGYEVTSATSGDEAIEAIDGEGLFDLAILDVEMPPGDGLQALRAIKRRSPGTRVLVTSSGVEWRDAALRCAADEFISKPFSVRALRDLLTPPT